MKIIISHDVDHLYPSDHIFRDMIFPKLWMRSLLELLKGKIDVQCFLQRLFLFFRNKMHCIPEIMEYDRRNEIPSVFFFGMANALGMVYHKRKAEKWIHNVRRNNFDVGVHGINYDNSSLMKEEFDDFKQIAGELSFGIRTHYVRYNNETFQKMSNIGYLFDSSEYDRKNNGLKSPYKVGKMWEFPLHIMDSSVMKNGLIEAQSKTLVIINAAEKSGVQYLTFLFHDIFFNEKCYPNHREYYMWFVDYCKNRNYEFVSYREAIEELES